MINFATLQGLTIPEGVVTQITDASGRVLWSAVRLQEDRAVLTVTKKTATTYAGETEYADESFVLLDIYPLSGGTVNVTYGGLTKTITDDGTTEEPNAQQVFFGTFNGVSDSVTTPDSGTLTIEGNFAAYGCGSYGSYANKSSNAHCACITGVTEVGDFITNIPSYAFYNCTALTSVGIPESVTSIGDSAFYGCTALTSISTLKCATIGDSAFYNCAVLSSIPLAEGVVSIGADAFKLGTERAITTMKAGSVVIPSTVQSIGEDAFATTTTSAASGIMQRYLSTIQFLSATPPALGDNLNIEGIFGYGSSNSQVIVPVGALEAYKSVAGASWYDSIVEVS